MPPISLPAPVQAALAEALAFVFPVWCAGCGEPGEELCDACRDTLRPAIVRRRLDGFEVVSGLAFDGVAARVVRALKEDGRPRLARPLAPALAVAADAAGWAAADVVVPVPASARSMRSRGYRVAELLARRADLAPSRLLRVARATADQRTLTRDERRSNVAGSMRAHGVAGLTVLIVDDVVTTGATLTEAARALREGGAEVVGAATAAGTPRRFVTSGSAGRDRARTPG